MIINDMFVPTKAQLTPEDLVLLLIEDLPNYLDQTLTVLTLHTKACTLFIIFVNCCLLRGQWVRGSWNP